jgi:hypothetical protein
MTARIIHRRQPESVGAPKLAPRFLKNLLIPSTFVTCSTVISSYEEPEPAGTVSPRIDLGVPLFFEGSQPFDNELSGGLIDPDSRIRVDP